MTHNSSLVGPYKLSVRSSEKRWGMVVRAPAAWQQRAAQYSATEFFCVGASVRNSSQKVKRLVVAIVTMEKTKERTRTNKDSEPCTSRLNPTAINMQQALLLHTKDLSTAGHTASSS